MTNHGPLWISDSEVAAALTPDLCYRGVASSLAAHTNGLCVQPLKPYVRPGGREREFELGRHIAMPCYVGGEINAVGIKWISSVPKNLSRGRPRASGVIILNDVEGGQPIAIMDCATLSARRTAAVAAVCWNHFGSPNRVVSLLGCGPVNRAVAVALNAVDAPPVSLRVFDLDESRAVALRDDLAPTLGFPITVSPSLGDCCRGAWGIVAAATGSKGYIDPEWLADCRLMLPLSLDDFRAETLLQADKIIVDEFEGCAREEKLFHRLFRDGQLSRESIYAELGQVVTGVKAGRTGDERVFANLMGMAVEDIAVAKLVYEKIQAARVCDQTEERGSDAVR